MFVFVQQEFEEQQPHSNAKYLEARQMVKDKYKELSQKRKELVEAEVKLDNAI